MVTMAEAARIPGVPELCNWVQEFEATEKNQKSPKVVGRMDSSKRHRRTRTDLDLSKCTQKTLEQLDICCPSSNREFESILRYMPSKVCKGTGRLSGLLLC